MKARVFLLLGMGAAALVAIAIAFHANHNESIEPVAAGERGDGTQPAANAGVLGNGTQPTANSGAVATALAPSPQAADSGATSSSFPIDYLALGQSAFAHHDYAACVEDLRRAATHDPGLFQVHYLLGLSYRYLGRLEESNGAFDRALEIAPRDLRALVGSARTLLELQRADDAETRVRLAIEVSPTDAGAWNVLGRAQLARGQLADAESSFTRAVERDSSNAYARNNLGLARLRRGDWAGAAAALEGAVRINGGIAYFHNNLGLVYERLGRFEEAAREFARAVEIQPEHAAARLALERVTPRAQLARDAEGAPGDTDSTSALVVKP